MSSPDEFSVQLQEAVEQKEVWFDTTELPDLLENYRLLHTCVKNLFDVLAQRGLIIPDPYKLDKKISSIKAPEGGPYGENERAKVLGQRFSDYESTLDYICTYYKFSIENLTLGEIKKLTELNASFQWDSFSTNSSKSNTRGLSNLMNLARQQTTGITVSNINDALNRSAQAMSRINHIMHELTDFTREQYKNNIRVKIIANEKFDSAKAMSSIQAEVAEIKRLYPELIGKKSFFNDLVLEIANEDQAGDKDARRAAVLAKLAPKTKKAAKKVEKVDTKEMILEAAVILTGAAPQYEQVHQKLLENNQVLNTHKNTFGEKLKKFFRNLFKIPPKQIDYTLSILDPHTQTRKSKKIEFTGFVQNLEKRIQLYNAIATRQSSEYNKLKAAPEETILNFVGKQISENQEILVLLAALDEFFKANAEPANRQNIKGLKMEMTSLKNCIVKTNQKKADYSSFMEEQAQMKKLGIDNDGHE